MAGGATLDADTPDQGSRLHAETQGNPVLDPSDSDRRSRTCSAGGTEGRTMRPEVAGLIAGATVTLSSVLFGLAAKDTNPWFVVWVVLSATIVVGLALSVGR